MSKLVTFRPEPIGGLITWIYNSIPFTLQTIIQSNLWPKPRFPDGKCTPRLIKH